MPCCFDEKKWLSQVRKRHAKALASGKSVELADTDLNKDVLVIDGIGRVIEWCNRRGIDVEFTSKPAGHYIFEAKTVICTFRASPMFQLATILHECGHYLVDAVEENKAIESKKYENGYPAANDTRDTSFSRSFAHRIDVIAEEMDAWTRGWKLANRLGIKIDRREFVQIRNSALKTHIRWLVAATDALVPENFLDLDKLAAEHEKEEVS